MEKQSDFEWDPAKDQMNQRNTASLLPWRSLFSWIIIVSSYRTWNTVVMKSDIIALAESLVEL